MSKDYISLINFSVMMCGGVALRDIVGRTMKELPHSKGLITMIGRSAIRAGAFVTGAKIAAIGVKFVEEITDSYGRKTKEKTEDSVEVVEEDSKDKEEDNGRAE